MLEAIIFDNWNTLVQAPGLMRSGASVQIFHRSLTENGFNVDCDRFTEFYRPIAREQVSEAEKNGWTEIDYLKRLLMVMERLGVKEPRQSRLAVKAWDDYLTEWLRQTSFFPETPSMLESLRGRFRLGVLTNFMDGPTAREVFDNLGYEEFFDSLVVSAEVGYMKPSPVIYRRSLEELGVKPEACIMVGDTYSTDIKGAHSIGMRGVLIDWDWSQCEYHTQCDHVIRTIGDFPKLLKDLV